ncbi:hypothetical protein [Coleofasciculus sp. H7-2]
MGFASLNPTYTSERSHFPNPGLTAPLLADSTLIPGDRCLPLTQ